MKKAIAILAVVAVALVGLTSYNTNEEKKNKTGDTLIASLKSNTEVIIGGNQKKD